MSSPTELPNLATAVDPTVLRARRAVYIAFSSCGFAFASWASRIPQVKHSLALDPGQLGLVLLSIAVGSTIALPLAGMMVTRVGASRTVASLSVVLSIGLATVAVGQNYGVTPVVIGLFLFGFSTGIWDVAMNVEGAAVEQRLGRTIMSRFHAGWSLGTVLGALVGAVMIATHVPVAVHLLIVSGLILALVPWSVRGFLPVEPAPAVGHEGRAQHPLQAWTEPRTLLIGLFVLSAAFAEGTGNDWLGITVIDGYHAAASIGSLTLAVFLAAMTTARWFGTGILDRYGRIPLLRGSFVAAATGLLLVVFGPSLPFAIAGSVIWGLGAALGFPVGMSAAADDPARAAARVSVVASIGYVAFLAGPPVIGLLGDHVGVRHALTATVGVLALGLLVSGACRPLPIPETVPGASSLLESSIASGTVLGES
jgi:MFS family permease